MKKILLITSEFPPLPGGIGNHAYSLANFLHNSAYEISVLSDFRSETEDLLFDEKQHFKIYRIERNKRTQFNRIKKAFLLAKHNQTIICSGKFSLWIGGLLKKFYTNKRSIAVIHGSEIRAGGAFSKAFTHWSLKQFDAVIAVSNFTKEVALKYNPKLIIEVINNGFVIPKMDSRKSNIEILGCPKIVTVGNVTYRKGQQNVITVLPLLKEVFPEIQYHVVGIPTEKEAFTELATKLNVENNVIFHGALTSSDFAEVLNAADVFIMLSDFLENGDFEGFGIAIVEANALGKPAIGSFKSGISDAINAGFSGELVNLQNKEEVLQALIKIMNSYDFYSKNAVNWSQNFTWDKVGSEYIKILEK